MEEIYYIWQIILVAVLVAVTIYYAIQTHRQANLLKRQMNESRNIHRIGTLRQSIEEIEEWAQYGVNEYCIPGLGRFDRGKYPVSVAGTTRLVSLGNRALGNASYIGGDLQNKVKQSWDTMVSSIKSQKTDTQLNILSDAEYEQHIDDFQKSLGNLSKQLSEVIRLCQDLRIKLDMETLE